MQEPAVETDNGKILVRLAVESDITQICEITSEVVPLMQQQDNFQWDSEYPLEKDFREDLKLSQLWVCEVDGTVAGFAGKFNHLKFIQNI